jgi:hypothetical protein
VKGRRRRGKRKKGRLFIRWKKKMNELFSNEINVVHFSN